MPHPSADVPAAGDRPVVAIIETLREARPTSILVALALARARLMRVILCHWHVVEFSSSNVWIRGSFYQITDDLTIEGWSLQGACPVKALFFYGPNCGTLQPEDTPALERLNAAGIDACGVPLYEVVDRLMLAASLRGAVTNALGASRTWGPKHYQELKIRRYEKATGRSVTRPKTYIARPFEFHAVLSRFARNAEICLVKPLYGEGGRGLRVVHPGESLPRPSQTMLVQRLIPDPLLIEAHKADLRFYLLIDPGDRHASTRLRPIFVRRAPAPYVPGSETAEITNTQFRVRLGLLPDMRPFTPRDIGQNLYQDVITQLNAMTRELLDAYFFDLTSQPGDARRLILFGVDALIAAGDSGHCGLYFLEINPFPAFFRGVSACDEAMKEMFSTVYAAALVQSMQRQSARNMEKNGVS